MACPIIWTLNISHEIIQSSALIQTGALCKFTLDDCRERLLNSLLLLAGRGGFAVFLVLLDGSYAQAAASAIVAPPLQHWCCYRWQEVPWLSLHQHYLLGCSENRIWRWTAVGCTAVFPFQIRDRTPHRQCLYWFLRRGGHQYDLPLYNTNTDSRAKKQTPEMGIFLFALFSRSEQEFKTQTPVSQWQIFEARKRLWK